MFAPDVLDPAVGFLAELAGDGPALEFAIGTGRVAVPLVERGVPVSGIELSQPMVDQLRRKKRTDIPVVVGDMATSTVPGRVLARLRRVEQHRQPADPGRAGRLLPQRGPAPRAGRPLRHRAVGARHPALPAGPGRRAVPRRASSHVGFDTYDMVTQQGTSHHYRRHADGSVRYGASNFRYIWPAECDLMARLAGLELEQRVADWNGSPFTSDSESHVSVWRKPIE